MPAPSSSNLEAEASSLIISKFGQSNVSSVDSEVLIYLASVLADKSSSESEVTSIAAPFFPHLDPSLSPAAALDAAREIRRAMFGIQEDEDAFMEGPVKLSAPKRMDGEGAILAKGDGATKDLGGGNANQQLDRRNEAEAAKALAQARKERRAGKIGGRIVEESRATVSSLKTKIQAGTRDVKVEGVDLSFGGLTLLEGATLNLAYGRRYGVIGRNGIGKSTLMKAVARRELPISEELDILYVEQEVVGDDTTPLQSVLESDEKLQDLLQEEKDIMAGNDDGKTDTARLEQVYKELEAMEAHSAESRAAAILSGLGFEPDMQMKPSKEFSGGWRMRIALARALFCEPKLLLLDEPTNHLDLHTVLWLSDYLTQWPHTLVVVSHDRDFLNDVCTDIIYVKDKLLHPYTGNFDDFEQTRAEKLKDMTRSAERDDTRIAHLQKFVDRFRYNAKRAQMAQSRLKMIQKMEESKVVLPGEEEEFAFTFPDPGPLPGAHGAIQLCNVTFGYTQQHRQGEDEDAPRPTRIIFKDLDFSVDTDARIALVGPNGAGKSTIIKLITSENIALEGEVKKSSKIRIGYFSQHHIDQLVLWRTPLEHMKVLFPAATIPELRGHLGKLGLRNDMVLRPISTLSGGQKSRVAFAIITWQKPHLLLLDEPTNHLDIETIDALVHALNEFSGGVVLVSHDARLISTVCDEIHICQQGGLLQYPGEFKEYRQELVSKMTPATFKQKGGV